MIKQEIKIKNTYWLEHKIFMDYCDLKKYPVIKDFRYSKQKNIIARYGSLEKYYENI